jgi:hypothetical protein
MSENKTIGSMTERQRHAVAGMLPSLTLGRPSHHSALEPVLA